MTSEPSQTKDPHRWVRRYLSTLPWVLLIYLFSIGPVFWYWHSSFYMGGNAFLTKLYYPLLMLCEIDFIGEVVNNYIGLWIY